MTGPRGVLFGYMMAMCRCLSQRWKAVSVQNVIRARYKPRQCPWKNLQNSSLNVCYHSRSADSWKKIGSDQSFELQNYAIQKLSFLPQKCLSFFLKERKISDEIWENSKLNCIQVANVSSEGNGSSLTTVTKHSVRSFVFQHWLTLVLKRRAIN